MAWFRHFWMALVFLWAGRIEAATLQVPVGGAPVPVPEGKVTCGSTGSGWTADSTHTRLRPPAEPSQVGHAQTITVAASPAGCLTSKETLTLVPIGSLPAPDRKTVELLVDEGRLEVRGTELEGARLTWQSGDQSGSDTCSIGPSNGPLQSCTFAVGRRLPADSTQFVLWLLPAGAGLGADAYDASGRLVPASAFQIVPAKIVLSSLLPHERVLDVAAGEARLQLTHPEAVAAVDCTPARCELAGREVVVHGITGAAHALSLRLRLLPRVYVREGDFLLTTVSAVFDLAYCPLNVSSGSPLREVDDQRVVVQLDSRCGTAARSLAWTANGAPAAVLGVETAGDAVYVLLGIGRIGSSGRLTITASRRDREASVAAMTTVSTITPPRLHTNLTLPGYGIINFIPTNRSAVLGVIAAGNRGQLVALPVDGAYTVLIRGAETRIRGVPGAGGYVALRFGYRQPGLPGQFARVDLAELVDTVQRPLEIANVPAPIGESVGGRRPIIEFVCEDRTGRSISLPPGKTIHVPFSRRDSCHLIIHRRRILPEEGEQGLSVEISITSVGGANRPEGHLSQRLVMQHGDEERVLWVHGVTAQYDRVSVRVTHVLDETQYLHVREERLELPVAQWTVVMEDTHFRFYATAAIPVSLFRFSKDPKDLGTGSLTLNVGMLSRLTWLTRDGNEGLLGLEAGVMGMGLASDSGRQLNIVSGIGFSVPLGNAGQPTQAALNIHAWAAYRLGRQSAVLPAAPGETPQTVQLNPWSFVFGPSVTIGNIGLDL